MRILFDQGVPKPLAKFLIGHEVRRAFELGWVEKKNGELIKLAEENGFEMLMMTTDQNLRYQQNLRDRKIAVFILGRGNWPDLEPHATKIAAQVNVTSKSGFHIFEIKSS